MIRRPAAATPTPGWAPDPPTIEQLTEWDLDPTWSRFLDVPSHLGGTHRWHVLDTAAAAPTDQPVATVVCVHGNPTWGYAWATFLRRFGGTHRVIAVDQLGMGYSERTSMRRYATRVRDLADVIEALDVDASRPLFLAAHDWGGAVAMGWAVDHVDQLDGMILCNTGIAVPEGRSAPGDHPPRGVGADARTGVPRHADVRRGHRSPVRQAPVGR